MKIIRSGEFIMKNTLSRSLKMTLSLIVLGLLISWPLGAQDVSRMTKEELKGILGHPDVVVIDVRYSQNWQDSDLKIKSAIRGNPDNFSSWFDQFPKEKTLVLY